MSTDRWTYVIICEACGNRGVVHMWSDDWCRWGANMSGFKGPVSVTGPRPSDLVCVSCLVPNPKVTYEVQGEDVV